MLRKCLSHFMAGTVVRSRFCSDWDWLWRIQRDDSNPSAVVIMMEGRRKRSSGKVVRWILMLSLLQASLLVAVPVPDDVQASLRRLKNLTLDELLAEPVITASKSPQPMSRAAAAIQVITSEDIRRSSASTLPEALRLASNLQVARAGAASWAISARGFNNTLANKLLVMIDGRAVYTPLYAGVFWDVQNVLLEDVERIEVVSGPGGTLWGANAVNGVINVITKSARETQGTYLAGAAGSFLQDLGAVRYGGGNGTNVFYRVYAQHFDFNSSTPAGGGDDSDAWKMTQGGFRMDWETSKADTITVQGDLYSGKLDGAGGHTDVDGQNLLSRWNHVLDGGSAIQLQVYYDRTWREAPNYAEDLNTFDIDFQHRFQLGEAHSIIWGGGYRLMMDRIQNTSPSLAFLPEDRNLQLFSGFIQDDIQVVPDRFQLSIGSKFEHNDYSGFELQPSVRGIWTVTEAHSVWGAISRAVRAPSRVDTELYLPAPPVPPDIPKLAGGPGFDSEELLALELGYRVRVAEPLWMAVTGFYNFYDKLRSLDQVGPNDYILANNVDGEVRGVELNVDYTPARWWRLRGGYTYLHKELWRRGGVGMTSSVRDGNDPEHQFTFHSIVDLTSNMQLDISGRYADALPSPAVPAYFALDARLAWEYKDLEIALVGQNLIEPQHREFGLREIPRAVYGMVALRF